jgi:hypothetical protein
MIGQREQLNDNGIFHGCRKHRFSACASIGLEKFLKALWKSVKAPYSHGLAK